MRAGKLVDLLKAAVANGDMCVVLKDNSLMVGTIPLQPSNLIDFSLEQIISRSDSKSEPKASQAEAPTAPRAKVTRRRGAYWFELSGRRTDCGSLKELLAESLRALEKYRPGMIEDLSRQKGRNRRIVAHNPADLYEKPHLADEYAEKLVNGWYYGTNNSAQQTKTWLERAVECARLSPTDFKSSLD